MSLKFNITIKLASREDNRRGFVNMFAGEFNLFLIFVKERFRTFKIIHVEKIRKMRI